MNKKLLFLFFTISLNVSAQKENIIKFDTIRSSKMLSIADVERLYSSHVIFLGTNGNLIRNDSSYSGGFANKNYKKELKRSDAAWNEYRTGIRHSTAGLLIYAGAITGAIILSSASPGVGSGILLAGIVIGSIELSQVLKHFNKALWLYNRDALLDAMNRENK